MRFVLMLGLLVSLVGVAAEPTGPNPPKTGELVFMNQLAALSKPTRSVVYKRVGDRELRFDIFLPTDFKPTDRRVGWISFHGGGWSGGSPPSMYPYAAWAAEHGLVGISVEYRLYKAKTCATVFECVKDARSAMRYAKTHAAELGLDPDRLIAVGSSAGGLLAAGTELFDQLDSTESSEAAAVSASPSAMILLWPVIDTSKEGYGQAKIGERWRELSPLHHVRAGMPPTLLFHGTADTTVPFAGAQSFHDAMLKAGNRCDFVIGPGGGHGFITKDAASFADALSRIESFLVSLRYLPAPKPATPR